MTMTVPEVNGWNRYISNGSTLNFPYNFAISDRSEILVMMEDDFEVYGTHYNLTGIGNSNGGQVQFFFFPPDGNRITIVRRQALAQLVNFLANSSYEPLDVGQALDDATKADQMLAERIGRACLFELPSTYRDLSMDDPIASQLLRWRSDLSGIESVGISALGIGGTIATLNAGQVVFASSNTSIDTDEDLTWDIVNKRLGIGTATPEVPLHVKADVSIFDAVATGTPGHSLPSISLRNYDAVTPNGAGGFLRFECYNSMGVRKDAAQINGGFIDATAGAEHGDIDFGVYRNGVVEVIGIQADLPAFVPSVNAIWDLGSITGHWRNLFLQGILDHSVADDASISGPLYVMTRISTTPAVNDAIGTVLFRGRNLALGSVDYAGIVADILNPATGNEYGQIRFLTVAGGVLDTALAIETDIAAGETVMIVRNNKLGIIRFDRLEFGADDSGGAGFRMARFAN